MEDQAFLRSCYTALHPPPSPLTSADCLSFSVFLLPVELTEYWPKRGGEKGLIVRPRESLGLYKSFNTIWEEPTACRYWAEASYYYQTLWNETPQSELYIYRISMKSRLKNVRKTFKIPVLFTRLLSDWSKNERRKTTWLYCMCSFNIYCM